MRSQQLDFETAKACLEDIGARFKLGQLNEAEADAARLALLSQAHAPRWRLGGCLKGGWQPAIVVAAVFLLVTGVGAATSYVEYASNAADKGDAIAAADDDDLARLKDYATAVGSEGAVPTTTAASSTLPDVSTMIDRLAARLEKEPAGRRRMADSGLVVFPDGALRAGGCSICESGGAQSRLG